MAYCERFCHLSVHIKLKRLKRRRHSGTIERERVKLQVKSEAETPGTSEIQSRPFVSMPMIRPNSLEERRYQIELSQIAKEQNTLAVLPTGLGKTAIALLTIAHYLSIDPKNRCLILAPTRVLVHQHYSFLRNHLQVSVEEIGV